MAKMNIVGNTLRSGAKYRYFKPGKGVYVERLKKLWVLALRKFGISIHERIFNIKINTPAFAELIDGKRTAIITPWDADYQIDALVRLQEFSPQTNKYTNREAHLFISQIIDPDDTSCILAGYCVLVLN